MLRSALDTVLAAPRNPSLLAGDCKMPFSQTRAFAYEADKTAQRCYDCATQWCCLAPCHMGDCAHAQSCSIQAQAQDSVCAAKTMSGEHLEQQPRYDGVLARQRVHQRRAAKAVYCVHIDVLRQQPLCGGQSAL